MARHSQMTLEQLGAYAQVISWTVITLSATVGALIAEELARKLIPR